MGFTLIELLVVILIIGILSAVALPQYQKVVDKAKFSKYIAIMTGLLHAQQNYFMANGTYTKEVDDLDWQFPYVRKGTLHSDKTIGLADGATIRLMSQSAYLEHTQLFGFQMQYYLDYASGKRYCNAVQTSARAQRLCQSVSGLSAPVKSAASFNYYPF